MKNRKGFRTFTALLLAVMMILGNALAGTYYIEDGSIEVHASETSQTVTQAEKTKEDDGPVISNRDPETSSANTVTIKADEGCTANVKVEDLNIDVSAKENTPAVKTEGGGNVNIELDGNSSIKSGKYAAGLQKENTGNLTINDADQNGKLEAVGGQRAAGIGGGCEAKGEKITINGGEVTATGGKGGAGIGGGSKAKGENITINGGEVTATGGKGGAGIGGGSGAKGEKITINGGEVIANGRDDGAGIGGGYDGDGCDITINGGKVTAKGGAYISAGDEAGLGAGIGGGAYSDGKRITISGGEVSATGGQLSAGIGGSRTTSAGTGGHAEDITISGGKVTANGGYGGDGIGGGMYGSGKNIIISGGEVTANGGESRSGIGGRDGNITISGGEVVATGGRDGGTGISGQNITIEGGEITATGGSYGGAGIGGGGSQSGGMISISGGTVIAVGVNSGAGIGGERTYDGTDTMISGSAQVKVAGGQEYGKWGEGAGIGDGGMSHADGAEFDLDEKDLTCGSIEYYAKGTSAEEIKNETVQPIKTVDNPDIGHDYKTDWTYNETHHWHECKNDGCIAKGSLAAHTWEDYGGSAATCTENAVKPGKKCKCGKVLTEPEEVPNSAKGHTPGKPVKEKEKAAEVGVAGSYDEVVYCASCGTELSRKTVTIDPLPEPAKKNGEDFSVLLARKIRQAPENGTVEADAGAVSGLKKIVFEALEERPDVTVKLKTSAGDITIPAGANLLEKTGGKTMVSFEELKGILE